VSASAAAVPDFDSVVARALRWSSGIAIRRLRRWRNDSRSDLRSRRRGVAVSSAHSIRCSSQGRTGSSNRPWL